MLNKPTNWFDYKICIKSLNFKIFNHRQNHNKIIQKNKNLVKMGQKRQKKCKKL